MQGALRGHLKTVLTHKHYVAKYCFKFGLYWRGIKHDMSKFSFAEFWGSVHYYTGVMSPQVKEREDHDGYSLMCIHHTTRNTHHYQYHVDICGGNLVIIPLPYKDLIEMFCDSLAASIVYSGTSYTRNVPLAFFEKHMDNNAMHPASKEMLIYMFKEYELHDVDNLVKENLKAKYQEIQSKYQKVYNVPFMKDELKIKED